MYQTTGQFAPVWRIFVLSLFLFLGSRTGYAQPEQEKKIHLTLVRQPLPQSLKQLAAAADLVFAYDEQQLKHIVTPAMDLQDITATAALEKLLKGTGYGYKVIQNNIVISPLPKPVKQDGKRQAASLRGRIVDFETSQPLPGATVLLEAIHPISSTIPEAVGTGDSSRSFNRTLLTDERGYYHFRNLPDGEYQLTITYSGYQRVTSGSIALQEGREDVRDLKLQAGSSLNEVVVTSGGRKVKAVTYSTEKDLIAQIRNSTGVVSGISNEMISKTGDRNAAEVVRRISGVTVVDDRFIVVRGMYERYNLTYLNNNVAPVTELYSKAFAYDLLPSSVIDKITVTKSPVADLVADYGGGVIRVYTKNAMPVRHFDIGVQLGHRPGSTLTNIESYTGGKYDFFGFSDKSRKLPGFSPGYFQTEKRTSGVSYADMVKGFTNDLTYGTVHSLPDMQVFLNYYNTWKLGGEKRLYDLTSVTFTHETKSYEVYHQTGNTYAYEVDTTIGYNYGGLNRFIHQQQTSEIGKINILENLTLKLNKHHTFEFKNFIVNEGRKFTAISDSRDNVLPSLDSPMYTKKRDIILSFQQRLLYSGNFGGTHTWGGKYGQELSWNLGYTYALQHLPDQRSSHFWSRYSQPYFVLGTNANTADDGYLGMIGRVFTKNEENIYNASLDYTIRLTKDLQWKVGTYQLYKLRNVGRRFFRMNRGGLAPDEYYNQDNGFINGFGQNNPYLLRWGPQQLGTIWDPANFPADNTGLGLYDATNPTDSYVASEQNNAFYVMGDWTLAKGRVTVNGGLRLEYDRQKAASALIGGLPGSIQLTWANHPLTSWLPSVNIGYRPWKTVVFRAGYGRSLNRPEFREISSFGEFDYQNNERVSGDPGTVTAVLDNIDFRAELYPRSANQNEMINAGVFYKYIQHPIERLRTENTTSTGNSNFTEISFGNEQSAKVVGVEAEVRKSLSFIGFSPVFRNLSVVLNGAWIKSTTVQLTGSSLWSVRDTVKGRPLQGQSPYIVNAGLFYENIGWGTKLGLVYNVNGPRIYAKSFYNPNSKIYKKSNDSLQYRPDLLQLPFHQLDFSLTQRIVKSLQVKFTVQNILDQVSRIVEDHNYNQKYDPEYPVTNPHTKQVYYNGDNIYNSYKPGRYFLLQFTYAF